MGQIPPDDNAWENEGVDPTAQVQLLSSHLKKSLRNLLHGLHGIPDSQLPNPVAYHGLVRKHQKAELYAMLASLPGRHL